MSDTISTRDIPNLGTIRWEVSGTAAAALRALAPGERIQFEQTVSRVLQTVGVVLSVELTYTHGAALVRELEAAVIEIGGRAMRLLTHPRR
jgi:hypothetical protein